MRSRNQGGPGGIHLTENICGKLMKAGGSFSKPDDTDDGPKTSRSEEPSYPPLRYSDVKNTDLPSPKESPRSAENCNDFVVGYAANTNQGLFRNYNEDRVSIILNIVQPASQKKGILND